MAGPFAWAILCFVLPLNVMSRRFAALSGLSRRRAEPLPVPVWAQGRCHRPLLSETGFDGCRVTGPESLPPPFADNATLEVRFLRHPLWDEHAAIDWVEKQLKFTHSNILFREVGGTGKLLVFGFWADRFDQSTVIPELTSDGLVWKNIAHVSWFGSVDLSDWPTDLRIGYASGEAVNEWMSDWVLEFAKDHTVYQPWSIWSAPDVVNSRHFIDESICHTFTEEAMKALWRIGANFSESSDQVFCRNYLPFVAKTMQQVPTGDAPSQEAVLGFYSTFYHLLSDFQNQNGDQMFCDAVHDLLSAYQEPHMYVFDGASYYKAELKAPYFGSAAHLYQRMVLPWQDTSGANLTECYDSSIE